jgi:hypothetical protein
VRNRCLDRQLLGLLGACAATVILVVLGSCAYFGTTGIWHEWNLKIAAHYSGGSDWELGYRTIAEASFRNGVPLRAIATAATQHPVLFLGVPGTVVALLLLLPALTFIRGLQDHEALAYGFVFVFLLALAPITTTWCSACPCSSSRRNWSGRKMPWGWPSCSSPASWAMCSSAAGLCWPAPGSCFAAGTRPFPTYYFLCCFIAVTVAQMILLAGSKTLRCERQQRPNKH